MRWVRRDESGQLIGHFANPQPYAQEAVPDDHPDILAWGERRKKEQSADYASQSNPRQRTAEARIATLEANVEVLRNRLLDQQALEKRLAAMEHDIRQLILVNGGGR